VPPLLLVLVKISHLLHFGEKKVSIFSRKSGAILEAPSYSSQSGAILEIAPFQDLHAVEVILRPA